MARACIFCGGTGLTKEHVFPQWLTRDVEGDFPVTSLTAIESDGSIRWQSQRLDFTMRVVCATCNNGWMSQLEGMVSAILSDPIRSAAAFELDPRQQVKVALWATKTAMVLEAYKRRGFRVVPEAHLRAMPSGDRPPDRTAVFMFARRLSWGQTSVDSYLFSASGGITPKADGGSILGYTATFGFGHVGFHVIGFDPRKHSPNAIKTDQWVHDRMVPVWPWGGDVARWPPSSVMSPAEVRRVAFG